jgi:tRNA pseudouridine38-40 synthase
MHSIKLTLAYDGTDFHGWQIQPGQPTIQGALNEVVRKLTQEKLTIHGAGRTDAGVHASGQVAHFKTQSGLSPAQFQRAFNALLPPSIRVLAAEEVGPDFHARWQALAKTYLYRIFRGRVVPPSEWRYVLHYPYPLNVPAMVQAARLFEGEHDFTSFAASTGSEEDDRERTTVRAIYRSELLLGRRARAGGQDLGPDTPTGQKVEDLAAEAEELVYVVRGRSFLRFMVRKLVGTLLEVGRGKLGPADIRELFELRDRSRSGPTVPARGLCLASVEYPDPTASLEARP